MSERKTKRRRRCSVREYRWHGFFLKRLPITGSRALTLQAGREENSVVRRSDRNGPAVGVGPEYFLNI